MYYQERYFTKDFGEDGPNPWLMLLKMLFVAFVLGFGPWEAVLFCRLYLLGGVGTFCLRLMLRPNLYKEAGCAFRDHPSNLLETIACWPFELILFACGKNFSYADDYASFLFETLKSKCERECIHFHHETTWNSIYKDIEEIEKETISTTTALANTAKKTTVTLGSGAIITLTPNSYSQTNVPKTKEVGCQIATWSDFTLERQFWFQLKYKNLLLWNQNRWSLEKNYAFSYFGGGYQIPLFDKSYLIISAGPQISDGKVERFILFTNLIIQKNGWKIILVNRWQWGLLGEQTPWVETHAQILKTPLLAWLDLRAEEIYGGKKWLLIRAGPEFFFTEGVLKYFRLWPNYDFVRKKPDVRIYFSYSF